MTTICGANNVGKTNFLRALDLFFSLNLKNFEPDIDIPYQIAEATRGQGYKTQITCTFLSKKDEKIEIKAVFTKKKNIGKVLYLTGRKRKHTINENDCRKIINEFRFIFVESNNVDLSQRIAQIVNDDVLLSLDKMRKKQSEPMEVLEKFISKSKTALKQIEQDITKILKDYTGNVEGINSSNWKAEILFPEFIGLRDAISNLINFTLYDSNRRSIDTKGSGIQKIIVLSLIKYISEKSKKNVIWGIDEPEAFLQPALEKKVCSVLEQLSLDIPIIITTHSNHFINVEDTDNTFLFKGKTEIKEYARRKGEKFEKTETLIDDSSGIDKILAIKRYLGIQRNDSWEILPFNILVEGQEDKNYLISLLELYDYEIPNILISGGADKMQGYLNFLNNFIDELPYKTEVLCLLDCDKAGKNVFKNIINSRKKGKYKFNIRPLYVNRFDGETDEKFERTVEDLIPPKIFIDQLNKLLKKEDYSTIPKSALSKRTQTANNSKKIIEVAQDFVIQRNSDKERFEMDNKGAKEFICKKTCDAIRKGKYDSILKGNEKIKSFCKEIVNPDQENA